MSAPKKRLTPKRADQCPSGAFLESRRSLIVASTPGFGPSQTARNRRLRAGLPSSLLAYPQGACTGAGPWGAERHHPSMRSGSQATMDLCRLANSTLIDAASPRAAVPASGAESGPSEVRLYAALMAGEPHR